MTKLYFAGAEAFSDICYKHKLKILVSYFNIANKEIPKLETFLDSGAFSAHAQNKPINLKEYICYVKKNKNKVEAYAGLDVIGNPEETWNNHLIMKKANLEPLAVFHVGSDFKWLEKMKNEPYIGLGGMVPYSTNSLLLMKWLRKCFSIIPPETKVHGFGMTNPKIIEKFPFYSVDSTSWLAGNRYKTMYQFSKGRMRTTTVEGFRALHYKKIMEWNLIQWKKYADYLEEQNGIQKVTSR